MTVVTYRFGENTYETVQNEVQMGLVEGKCSEFTFRYLGFKTIYMITQYTDPKP